MRSTLKWLFRLAALAVTALAILDQLVRNREYRDWRGSVFGIPYDFRPPTLERIRERWWNETDPRLFTPHVFGVGWSINLARLKPSSAGDSDARPA